MLEYYKLILSKVSFEPSLFEKELNKSIQGGLKIDELKEFKRWCYRHYGHSHPFILEKYFIKVPPLSA
jgi:hypothetical protein